MRWQVTAVAGASALIALCALASAQPSVACKKTETQAECHARLKCNANEELEDCQKRLLKCNADEKLEQCEKRVHGAGSNAGSAGQGNGGNNGNQNGSGGDRGGGDRGGGDRGAWGDHDNDRGNDRGGGDRGGGDRGGDRGAWGDHDNDRGNDRGGDRGDRGNDRGGRDDGGGRRRGGGGGYAAHKTFGLGLELGEPAGLNGKYFLSKSGALDFGLGWIYSHYYYGDGFHLYGDYLFHPASLVSAQAFELPFYVGVGLRYWNFHYCFMGACDYGGSAVGIRVPVGIAFDFRNAPVDIFLQGVPVLDFVNGDYYNRYRDRAHFGIDFSIGVRYWFK